jgi:predicted PurR-regulated permease PerM
VLTGARSVAGRAFVCWFLLLFLLASQDSFLRSLVRVLPRLREKKLAVEVLRGIEREISRYLMTITLINLGLGAAIGVAMQLLGLPNPYLWGAMAALFNFIPYVGAICGAAIVGLVALLQDGVEAYALAVPATYLALSGIEGMLVTPAIVGRRLRLRPVVVFLGVLAWGWLWGIAGALLAIPMLVVLNILCRHVEPLQPLGEFLSEAPARAEPGATEASEAVPEAPQEEGQR